MDDFTKTPRPFYPSLSAENREIRLLHLESGSQVEAPRCRLSVVSLDSNPSYEALSYQWGQGTSCVLVDGHDILIPKNLEIALRKMRHASDERILWSDAICIDQSTIKERNEQVALMADIYRKCERCLIWLGNTDEFDKDNNFGASLPDLLSTLSTKVHLDHPDAPRISPMFGITAIPLMLLNAVGWWNRIWVVQEVILAPESLVMFGSFKMAFDDLVKAVEFIDEHDIGSVWKSDSLETDQLCHCMDRIKVTFIWADLLKLRDHVFRLLELTRRQPETGNASVTDAIDAHSNSPDIIDVLLSVRHRQSTDARDKIFGILSLVKNWRSWEPIKADYSSDMMKVYTDFAVQMLKSDYGPKTLLLARGPDSPPRAEKGFPTWVPNWTKEGSCEYEKILITEGRQTPRLQNGRKVTILGSTLELHGLSRGKIAKLSVTGAHLHKSYGQPPSMPLYQAYSEMLDSWCRFAGLRNNMTLTAILNRNFPSEKDALEHNEPSSSGSYDRFMEDIVRSEHTVDFMPQIIDYLGDVVRYRNGFRKLSPEEEVFLRTVIHNMYPLHLRQDEYHQEALCILRLLLVFYFRFADPDRFLTRLNSVVLTKMAETLEMVEIWRKKLFWTQDGKLGIGRMEMEVRDEILAFEGVENLFVVREVGMKDVEGRGEKICYELVGDCYVNGGQEENLNWESGKEIYLI